MENLFENREISEFQKIPPNFRKNCPFFALFCTQQLFFRISTSSLATVFLKNLNKTAATQIQRKFHTTFRKTAIFASFSGKNYQKRTFFRTKPSFPQTQHPLLLLLLKTILYNTFLLLLYSEISKPHVRTTKKTKVHPKQTAEKQIGGPKQKSAEKTGKNTKAMHPHLKIHPLGFRITSLN